MKIQDFMRQKYKNLRKDDEEGLDDDEEEVEVISEVIESTLSSQGKYRFVSDQVACFIEEVIHKYPKRTDPYFSCILTKGKSCIDAISKAIYEKVGFLTADNQ